MCEDHQKPFRTVVIELEGLSMELLKLLIDLGVIPINPIYKSLIMTPQKQLMKTAPNSFSGGLTENSRIIGSFWSGCNVSMGSLF